MVESFIQLAKNRKLAGGMVDAQAMHKQVLVLRLISKFRTLGMLHADLDPLKRQEKRYIADLDVSTYGFSDADFDTEFDIGSFKGNPPGQDRMRLRDLILALERDLLRHLRHRVHVHGRHAAKALHPGAHRAAALAPVVRSGIQRSISSSASQPRKRWSAISEPSTSGRSASRARAATP